MARWLRQYVGVDRLMPRGEYYVHLALAWKLTWKQYNRVHRTVLCTSQLDLTCEQGYVCELIICQNIEHKNSNLIEKHLNPIIAIISMLAIMKSIILTKAKIADTTCC